MPESGHAFSGTPPGCHHCFAYRGWRPSALPPANVCDPSGINIECEYRSAEYEYEDECEGEGEGEGESTAFCINYIQAPLGASYL